MKIGSDFELPIYNFLTGNYISAVGLIGGTKDEPLSIGNGCFRQEDNVAAEFNIPPVKNLKDFKSYIQYCIDQGNAIVQRLNTNYSLDIVSSAKYSKKELNSEQAWQFGCEPSLCAYNGEIFQPEPPTSGLRTFGFHIHIETTQDPFEVVKRMDYFLGVPSLDIDPDTERRKVYGKAGDCRIKPYGVEYRVLGSGLLNNIDWVWEKTQEAIKSRIKVDDKIKEIINNGKSSSIRIPKKRRVQLQQV